MVLAVNAEADDARLNQTPVAVLDLFPVMICWGMYGASATDMSGCFPCTIVSVCRAPPSLPERGCEQELDTCEVCWHDNTLGRNVVNLYRLSLRGKEHRIPSDGPPVSRAGAAALSASM